MPSHWDRHLLAAILLVDEQQVQDQILAVQRVQAMVAVEQLPELDHATPLPGIVVDVLHHLGDHVLEALAHRRVDLLLGIGRGGRVQAACDEGPLQEVLGAAGHKFIKFRTDSCRRKRNDY